MKGGGAMERTLTGAEKEQQFVETAWLNYFNQYLWEHGSITEKEYLRMAAKIASRKKDQLVKGS